MKKIFLKIASFCIALLVFVSTLSFTIESHYCGDVLVDSSIFGTGKFFKEKQEVKKEDIYSNIDEMLKSTLDTKNE